MPSRIAVVGCGYVGLTTGACLAHVGHDVVCADIDEDRVAGLQRGEMPIVEPGLENLVREGVDEGRLRFVVGAANAAAAADFVYLCVPTPMRPDGSADLSFIEAAAMEISPVLQPATVVVNKSTVPVGSTTVVEQALGRDDVAVVSNPEFLREGSAVHDFLHPDRIVIGADDESVAIRVLALYLGITAPTIVTDPNSAETIKYAANSFLAAKISFANALAAVCEAVGADMNDVVLGLGYDKRIGAEFLRPGPGWGGSCFVGTETLLVRRDERIRLVSFEELAAEVDRDGASGWEALSWRQGEPTPEFLPIAAVSRRPYEGEMVALRTKMGRRLTVTVDHPVVVGDGVDGDHVDVVAAADVSGEHWVPVAQGFPLVPAQGFGRVLDGVEPAGIRPEQIIVRLDDLQALIVRQRDAALGPTRRSDVRRGRTARLHELEALDVPTLRGRFGTTTNGTYVPDAVPFDEDFWRMVGLYLAEGHIATDGRRDRIAWSFHPTAEPDLVEFVRDYWARMGVKVDVRRLTTTTQVSLSSRLLAGWFEHVLRLGRTSYGHAVPSDIWAASPSEKRALLRGIWDGDGSWSLVNGGPSVVLEFGTVSPQLADGVLRLLGDLTVVARLKVGRTAKSTVDCHWISISGADQIEEALWLFPEAERAVIRSSIDGQAKRIRPTGYRRLSKNAAWVRVDRTERRPFNGTVYSVEVPDAHTVVTSGGLVCHQCLPKDTRALIRIAEEAGYDFDLLRGVVAVNDQQFERVADKATTMAGGSLDGKRVAVWGLTFKARTDDLRDSPALSVIGHLLAKGAEVLAFDPTISGPIDDHKAAVLAGIDLVDDPYAACENAEVLLVLTEWEEFRWLDFEKVGGLLAARRVVDARNLLDREALRRRGFEYQGIGRA